MLVCTLDLANSGGPDLRNRLGLTPVGDTIELTVFRDGNKLTVKLQIAPPQGIASGDAQIVPQLAGLKIANIDRTTPQGARVEGVLGILHAEFENAMALTGCRTVAEIGPALIAPAPSPM